MNKITQKDYIRMFEFGRIPSLIAEVFLRGYEDLEVCTFFDGEWWSSYLSLKSLEKTKAEGLELYKSKDHIDKFKKSFHEYRDRASIRFEEIISTDKINKSQFEEFCALWEEMYHYYRRTEFFYVDEVFGEAEQTEEHKKMMEDFGKFKFEAREMLNEIWFDGRQWYMKLSEILSKTLDVSIDDLSYFKIEEIANFLDGTVQNSLSLEDRKKSYFITNINGNVMYLYGDEALSTIKDFKGEQKDLVLKGTVANKGLVTGIARVLMFDMSKPETIADIISQVKEGDILVTETTSPEWMPACKRAGAIITAQGGLLSHAAIVSRELKVPCIVGVADALRIIKDGDTLEVDANNNSIRVLN